MESVLFFISDGLATTGQFNVVMKDASDDQTSARLTVHGSQPHLDPASKHHKEMDDDDDDEGVKICYRRRSRYFTGWGVKIFVGSDLSFVAATIDWVYSPRQKNLAYST